MWDFVDAVLYINLDSRTDRRNHMEIMTTTFGDKVQRVSALLEVPGYIGCTKSHIRALKLAIEKNWKNVLILEDDAEWNRFEEGYEKLKALTSQPYDVIMLASGCANYDSNTFRLYSAQTASAYLVNSRYIPKLLDNFEVAIAKLLETNDKYQYSHDMYWKILQKEDLWYVIIPSLIYQMPSYSDIENSYVEYSFI